MSDIKPIHLVGIERENDVAFVFFSDESEANNMISHLLSQGIMAEKQKAKVYSSKEQALRDLKMMPEREEDSEEQPSS